MEFSLLLLESTCDVLWAEQRSPALDYGIKPALNTSPKLKSFMRQRKGCAVMSRGMTGRDMWALASVKSRQWNACILIEEVGYLFDLHAYIISGVLTMYSTQRKSGVDREPTLLHSELNRSYTGLAAVQTFWQVILCWVTCANTRAP